MRSLLDSSLLLTDGKCEAHICHMTQPFSLSCSIRKPPSFWVVVSVSPVDCQSVSRKKVSWHLQLLTLLETPGCIFHRNQRLRNQRPYRSATRSLERIWPRASFVWPSYYTMTLATGINHVSCSGKLGTQFKSSVWYLDPRRDQPETSSPASHLTE